MYSWGSGANADTFTIDIARTVPEPSTWALMLVGFGGLCFAGYKRPRVQRASLRSDRLQAASLRGAQIGEKRVAQIELALDAPAAFILQLAGAIKIVDEVPFRLDQRQFEVIAELGQLSAMVVAILAILDVCEPVALMSADRSDDRLGKLAALRDRLEPLDRRFDRAPADVELLLLPLDLPLAVARVRGAAPSWRTTKGSEKRPSPTSVTEDDAEGQNLDQIRDPETDFPSSRL